MEQFKVIGPLEIAGKRQGDIVELDPAETNIQVLIDCGHIERIDKPATSFVVAEPVTDGDE